MPAKYGIRSARLDAVTEGEQNNDMFFIYIYTYIFVFGSRENALLISIIFTTANFIFCISADIILIFVWRLADGIELNF